MKAAHCKIVRREIDESEIGQQVSAAAMEHVRGCMKCREFHDSRRRLREAVGSLGIVAAPPDFGFRVCARLASEKARSRAPFSFGHLSFGFPSVALATLLLLIGAGFALRAAKAPTNSPTTARTEESAANPDASPAEQRATNGNQMLAGLPEGTTLKHGLTEAAQRRSREPRTHKSTVTWRRDASRLSTREYSTIPAPVIKREKVESLEAASIFPIEASSQPLKVSLDYDNGVSRTISVPALSFGSQRVLTGNGPSMVKASAKGVW